MYGEDREFDPSELLCELAKAYTPWEYSQRWRRRFIASLALNIALAGLAWVLFFR